MTILTTGSLKSDHINIHTGPASPDGAGFSIRNFFSRAAKTEPASEFSWRTVFALNQYYPELPGAFYCNKRLAGLIQEAIMAAGLFIIVQDNFRESGIMPCELPGFTDEDDYHLVNSERRITGSLKIWESQGGNHIFFHDRLILEILSTKESCRKIAETVEARCRDYPCCYEWHTHITVRDDKQSWNRKQNPVS